MKILIQKALDELRKFADKDYNADITLSYTNNGEGEPPVLTFKIYGTYKYKSYWSKDCFTLEEAISDWKIKVGYPEFDSSATKFIEN